MENNTSILNFDPIKAEVSALVENIKKTVIIQPGNITGYELMKSNKSVLQKKRKWVCDTFKADRDFHTKHNNLNREKEKEILSLINPLETELGDKISAIDEAKKIERRKLELPERQERLATINAVFSDDVLLAMDKADFESFFTEQKSLYLEEKERKMAEEQAKIETEKKRLADEEENARLRDIAVAKAKEESDLAAKTALANAEKEKIEAQVRADKEKADAILALELKAAKEKQDLIDSQKAKDDARIAKEIADKAKADKEKADAEEAQRQLESKKKYQKFLADNNYNDETDKIFDNCIYRFVAKYE
jgi:hypothetical protein